MIKNRIEPMRNLAQLSALAVIGLMLVTSAVYAQESMKKIPQLTEGSSKNPAENTESFEKSSLEKLLVEAEILIKKGKPSDAYALLEPLEFEHSGDTRFDYLIGIAALDSGIPGRATLALERVLAVDPEHAAARLDLARAYFQLGDLPRAKTEFALTLKQNTSAAARLIINRYLEEIAAQEAEKNTRITGYIKGTIGHDNNVNNSTSQAQIYVDVLGGNRTLDPTNVQNADHYYGVSFGGEVIHNLNPYWGMYAGADMQQRGNKSQTQFDELGLDTRAGLIFGVKGDLLRAGVLGGRYSLGDTHNRDLSGFNADWRHTLSPSNHLSVFGQYAQYRFVDAKMKVNDFNQQAIGAGWSHVLGDGESTLFSSLYHGTEKDVSTVITAVTPEGGRADGEKKFSGFRAGGLMAIAENTNLFISAGGQVGDFSKVNPSFLRQRSDRLYDLTVGASWHWDKLLVLRPQMNLYKNNSNIAIYGYDRRDVSLTIRRDFR